MTLLLRSPLAIAFTVLASCSSSKDETTPTPDPPDPAEFETEATASRLLARATFGPTAAEIDAVVADGWEAWIDAQMALPATRIVPQMESLGCYFETPGAHDCPTFDEDAGLFHQRRAEYWWQNVLYGPDQLRQRVAFALSEIFVVSERSDALFRYPLLLADYYDTLAEDAFGNYRDLLEDVTLHGAMGLYLSMVKNQKPNALLGSRPDENYARECMQLFSIGLEMLNPDGTPVLDGEGSVIPTYDQDVIVGMAHAFTGWNFPEAANDNVWVWLSAPGKLGPLEAWEEYHDTEPKLLVTGVTTTGGQTAQQDLDTVLDLLANHPNIGPFIGKQLIQRLVTSNPSPEYVARISAVFADDGTGERGDLGAVVRAILTDPEATDGFEDDPATFGKVREPLLRMTALMRAFDAELQEDGLAHLDFAAWAFNQSPLGSPSVFNFFSPRFSPTGPIAGAGLVAPEMEITTHTFINRGGNVFAWLLYDHFQGTTCPEEDCQAPLLDYAGAAVLAENVPDFVAYLDAHLLGGTMSDALRGSLETYLATISYTADAGVFPAGYTRVREALFLLAVSPDFAIQK